MTRKTLKVTFELVLHSDYHVGSGHRAGPLVDSALLRDHDRSPLIRGTALVGLLRDGLADLLQLEAAKSLPAAESKDRLFGKPEHRKRWEFSSARAMRGPERASGRWGAQDVTRVRINPRTRRADPQKLFSQEEGDARHAFRFTATCRGATDQDVRDALLLVAAARMVRHLGSARRRGRGECSISLFGAEGLPEKTAAQAWTDWALEEFKARWLDGAQAKAEAMATGVNRAVDEKPLELSGDRVRFRIVARLDEPVIVARRAEAGNAYETLSMIPGTALLGALATRASDYLGLTSNTALPDDFVAMFFRGGVRVSGLLPAKREGQTLYPAILGPRAIFTCENHPHFDVESAVRHEAHNFALRKDLPQRCPECDAKLKSLEKALTLQGQPVESMARREEAHIRIVRETGRVKTGDLFEYIALEAGQWLTGDLECANSECWSRLQEWADLKSDAVCDLRVGKAARRGYGLITFILQPLNTEAPSVWIGAPLEQRVTATSPLTLTLLTDAIVPDAWGRFYAGFERVWIAEMLGVKESKVTLLGNFASGRSVDAFNTYRRTPRWRDEAIIAGSAVGFAIESDGLALDDVRSRLRAIEIGGIGLRRQEGFGRVAFNHPVFTPDSLPIESIDLSKLPGEFNVRGELGIPAAEADFRHSWAELLDSVNWKPITEAERPEAFEPVARLLLLSRTAPLEEVKRRLSELGKPEYLWGKSIPAREKESKIDQDGLKAIQDIIDRLAQRAGPDERRRAIGLELLAERVAIEAARARQ